MDSRALDNKMSDLQEQAHRAISDRLAGSGNDASRCVLGVWTEPGGTIVLHLNSGGNALAVMHALWNRHRVDAVAHPEYGVLIVVR